MKESLLVALAKRLDVVGALAHQALRLAVGVLRGERRRRDDGQRIDVIRQTAEDLVDELPLARAEGRLVGAKDVAIAAAVEDHHQQPSAAEHERHADAQPARNGRIDIVRKRRIDSARQRRIAVIAGQRIAAALGMPVDVTVSSARVRVAAVCAESVWTPPMSNRP